MNLSPSTWALSNNTLPGHETAVVSNEIVALVPDGFGTVTYSGAPMNSASFELNYILGSPAGTVLTELRYTPTDVPEPTVLTLAAASLMLLRRRG